MAGRVDYYRLLQVVPTADPDVIRAAYRSLARKYHPDLPGGSLERMAALNDAWSILRDPVARETYDRALAEAAPSRASAQTSRWHAAPSPAAMPGRGPSRADRPSAGSERGASTSTGSPATGPAAASATTGASHAVIDFGRYAGMSVAEVARRDPDYLEWFARTVSGRRFGPEIEALLHRGAAAGTEHVDLARRGLFQRRYRHRLSQSG
jgi:curved DNA-binding protein CbpA